MKGEKDGYIAWLGDLHKEDVELVGGKGANLGEMFNSGFPVPQAFVVTTKAYAYFLQSTGLDKKINEIIEKINVDDTKELDKYAKEIHDIIVKAEMPEDMRQEIIEAYDNLNVDFKELKQVSNTLHALIRSARESIFVSVRSSATSEDSGSASFAGQNESFINVKGNHEVIDKVKRVFASIFTGRSIYYRKKKGFKGMVGIAAVVQKMINSDKSGVMFSVDPVASGDNKNLLIEAVFGQGEGIVSGRIKPDSYSVSRDFSILNERVADKKIAIVRDAQGITKTIQLTPEKSKQKVLKTFEVKQLAEYGVKLEEHYKLPQDVEFAIENDNIYIVQTRPITTLNMKKESYELQGNSILQGIAASPGIGSGTVKIVLSMNDLDKVKQGDILVTTMTNPDMVVTMQRASAIVTDEGGVTAHAAIVSREMGIPCFSGETLILTNKGFMQIEDAVRKIKRGEKLKTISFNLNSLKTEWKDILNASERISPTITLSASKNGKIDWNTITTTPEHKFFSIENRKPVYKKINEILEKEGIAYYSKNIPHQPAIKIEFNPLKAYICGAIFSDGYLRVRNDGSSSTVFVQKNVENKIPFINEVENAFFNNYGYKLKQVLSDYHYCYKQNITKDLLKTYENIQETILGAQEESVLKYLASAIDGDGNYIKRGNYIKISLDKNDLNFLQSLALSCLRLNMNYRIQKEKNQFRFYIFSDIKKIIPYLKRVSVKSNIKFTGDDYFSAQGIFSDIEVSGRKGIKSFVKNNCLLSDRTISQKVIPYTKNVQLIENLKKIMDSDCRAIRVKKIKDNSVQPVFNIEVADNNNYLVFTKFYTPLIVKNCVVGTEKATSMLEDGAEITVDGFTGKVYRGKAENKKIEILPVVSTNTKIKVIVDLPEFAERAAKTKAFGVGLVRIEGIIASSGKHPIYYVKEKKIEDYKNMLKEGIEKIANAFIGKEVWIRTSDIRTDEYSNLEGAPKEIERNPMLGMHGIRFSLKNPEILKAELLAIKELAEKGHKFGIMFPQVISPKEIEEAKKIMQELGMLNMPEIKVGVMIETPAAVVMIEELCKQGISFISFGTNDLTQYTLAIDRGNDLVQYLYNETDLSMQKQLSRVIRFCKQYKVESSICGQAGSNKDMVEFLVKQGIDSISVNADAARDISEFVQKLENLKKMAEKKQI